MINSTILEACNLEEPFERLMAAVLRLASIDYIKAKRKYNKGLISKSELELQRKIYGNCIDNWSPYTYDLINSEFMITECDRIAESGINVDKMGNFQPAKEKKEKS